MHERPDAIVWSPVVRGRFSGGTFVGSVMFVCDCTRGDWNRASRRKV